MPSIPASVFPDLTYKSTIKNDKRLVKLSKGGGRATKFVNFMDTNFKRKALIVVKQTFRRPRKISKYTNK